MTMETRSQSRQQGEQLAELTKLIQQQRTEQKQQFEQLATTQREVLQKQEAQLKYVDSQVDALQSDMESLKAVTLDRLRATEEEQTKLIQELQATRVAIREELLAELEAKFTSREPSESTLAAVAQSKLKASATEFVPSFSPTTVVGTVSQSGHVKIQRPIISCF